MKGWYTLRENVCVTLPDLLESRTSVRKALAPEIRAILREGERYVENLSGEVKSRFNASL